MLFLFKYWLPKKWHLTGGPLAGISVMPLSQFAVGLCPVWENCCHLDVGDGLITVFVPPLCQLVVPFNPVSAVLVSVPHQCTAQVGCSGNCQSSVLLLSRAYSWKL